jgi:hypothetical protein
MPDLTKQNNLPHKRYTGEVEWIPRVNYSVVLPEYNWETGELEYIKYYGLPKNSEKYFEPQVSKGYRKENY